MFLLHYELNLVEFKMLVASPTIVMCSSCLKSWVWGSTPNDQWSIRMTIFRQGRIPSIWRVYISFWQRCQRKQVPGPKKILAWLRVKSNQGTKCNDDMLIYVFIYRIYIHIIYYTLYITHYILHIIYYILILYIIYYIYYKYICICAHTMYMLQLVNPVGGACSLKIIS